MIAAHERGQEPVGMARLHVALDAFGAEHSTIEREFFPGLEADDGGVANLQLNAALLPTKTAMRLDQALRGVAGFVLPAAGRSALRVGSELLQELGDGGCWFSHRGPLERRFHRRDAEGAELAAQPTVLSVCRGGTA